MITIGIDPDSEAHGVAIYKDSKLIALHQLELMAILELARTFENSVQFAVEDVLANDFIYHRNAKGNKAVHAKVALSVGRCQQAQAELMRALTHAGYQYKTFPPQAGNWADNKKQFEQITGWRDRSNKDTRSAAFFGFMAATQRLTTM